MPDASSAARPRVATPALSLIVCTRDRAVRLAPTLDALGALRAARAWELVLVDNGSRDGTPALLARFAREAARAPQARGGPLAVTVVREDAPGLARARNAGVAAARAPLLCFTDDDCYPAPDFVDRWAEVLDDPAVGYGGGRIVLHDPDDYPITVRPDLARIPNSPYAYVLPGLVQGANMAFRRAVLEAAGGFDVAMGPGAPFNCEDVDAAARASATGAAGGFFPSPTVRHHHGRRAGPAVAALERSYAHGRGAYHLALLLRRGARRHAVRAWVDLLRDAARGRTRRDAVRFACEIRGAAQYAVYRAAGRGRPAPPTPAIRARASADLQEATC